MTWLDDVSQSLAAEMLRLRPEMEGAPLEVHRVELANTVGNLATMESAVSHFSKEKGLAHENPVWFAREVESLGKARRKLAVEGAARLLLYFAALGEEETEDGNCESADPGS